MLHYSKTRRALTAAVFVMCALAPASVQAAQRAYCTSIEETEAFQIRHLQSRLMVAALSCNQQAAYNTFVENFRARLVDAGGRITAYFARIGGGQVALNSHITELANAAGLNRAEEYGTYCKVTWDLFWMLDQEPRDLVKIAAANTLVSIAGPRSCAQAEIVQAGGQSSK